MYLIDRYLSVKYQAGGRVFPNLDCWGLVITFFRDELGIDIPLTKSLASQKNSKEIETEIKSKIIYNEVKNPSKDSIYIVCFYDNDNDRVVHCGILLSGKLLHTSKYGTKYESISDAIRFHPWTVKFYLIGCEYA